MGCSSGSQSEASNNQSTNSNNTNNKQVKSSNIRGTDITITGPQKLIQKYVIRKDIRSLSSSEQTRFYNAAVQMLTNTFRGGESSEFFRIAKMHGCPEPFYCSHGIESFLSWHRPFLIEFEEALQRAD